MVLIAGLGNYYTFAYFCFWKGQSPGPNFFGLMLLLPLCISVPRRLVRHAVSTLFAARFFPVAEDGMADITVLQEDS